MASLEFYETFHREMTEQLAKSYPETQRKFPLRERVVPTLVSPYVLELPAAVRHQAEQIVDAFFRLRNLREWQTKSASQLPAVPDPGNSSILMSYDFHIDANGDLRLIEINTNASLSLIVDELHRFQKIENVFSNDFRREILDSFQNEVTQSQPKLASKPDLTVGIIDTDAFEQKLFIEFAMYRELFEQRGWKVEICDSAEAPKNFELIYNRDTDFYFSSDRMRKLRDAMMAKSVTITPHPHEYRLLADKDRLLELSDDAFLESLPLETSDRETIRRTLIKTVEVAKQDPEQLWKDRKKWFFKPRRSHGGKAVYRGSSTSRGTFQNILAGDYLAQEIVPPPTVSFSNEDEELKYDLRFYVYQNKIQLACARLYRGQMTNSQSPGGGVAPISWK